jgi:hypothetical protein
MTHLQTARPIELVSAALDHQPHITRAIAQDIDRSFAGRSGFACLGYIEGDPLIDDMRQEFFICQPSAMH